MVEQGSVHSESEAFEPDPLYPDDDFVQRVGMIVGDPFARIFHLPNIASTDVLDLRTQREVKIVVLRDQSGFLHFKAYHPDEDGPEGDIEVMGISDFEAMMEEEEEYAPSRGLAGMRKKRASRTTFDTDDWIRERGGDPDYRMPKTVFQRNKLC